MEFYLQKAIQLAKIGENQSGNQPPVGAVLVKNGSIIGFGSQLKSNINHAEEQAIDMATDSTMGSTLYTSLEPCSHYGDNSTCFQKIVDAGITQIVYAAQDNYLSHSSSSDFKKIGIQTVYKPNKVAMKMYEKIFSSLNLKRPIVTVMISCSLDGKKEMGKNEIDRINNKAVREDIANLRRQHDAIIMNYKDFLTEDRFESNIITNGAMPIQIILSESGNIDFSLDFFNNTKSKIYIVTENKKLKTRKDNVSIITVEDCSIDHILEVLYSREISKILIESEPFTTSRFLDTTYVTDFILYLNPKIIGSQGVNQYYQHDTNMFFLGASNFKFSETFMVGNNLKLIMKKKNH